MLTPYKEGVFDCTSERNIFKSADGEKICVQFTCYIHVIMGMIKELILNHENIQKGIYNLSEGKVVNHKDGDKLNNHLYNLEMVSRMDNSIHGAVFNSILEHQDELEEDYNMTLIKYDSNRSEIFKGLQQGISSEWIIEYLVESGESKFKSELETCIKTMIHKKAKTKYISLNSLEAFINSLIMVGYWKGKVYNLH